MGEFEDEDSNKKKPHRQRLSGRKLEKKKAKSQHIQELTDRQKNPKAFAIGNAVRAEKKFRRTQDLKRKKEHIPVVDRTPLEPPPILVAVVGPPKVGKSTLIRSLIKSYTRQPLTTIKGPVTIVSGKKRRITIIECNNDINCLVDIAKVADLVLLLIDASFGFEMEIFEFLNICQVHGMPKIMGILTHLDMIKQAKKIQRTKKLLKHRFWKEVYPGAKLFYLSDMQYGLYLKHEIKNLARFISVMKFRPLIWQTSHPYILADRMEDTTPPEKIQLNPKVNRTVCLYGYMRGIPMNKNAFIHIPGCGDFAVSDISFLHDPCPLPEQLKKRTLIEKERSIYAPFSGVGGIVYDKDAVYIELPSIQQSQNKNTPGKEVVNLLFQTKETMDTKLASSKMQFFSGSEAITASEFDQKYNKATVSTNVRDVHKNDLNEMNSSDVEYTSENESENDGENSDENLDDSEVEDKNSEKVAKINNITKNRNTSMISANGNHIREKINSAIGSLEGSNCEIDNMSECSSSSEDDESMVVDENGTLPWDKERCNASDSELSVDSHLSDTDFNWKNNLAEKASKAFIVRQATKADLWKLVYGDLPAGPDKDENDGADEIGGLFRVVSKTQERLMKEKDNVNALDSSKFHIIQMRDWTSPEILESIRDCFITGKWNEDDDADELLKLDDLSDNPDEELYGDFEDLETGEKFVSKEKDDSKRVEFSKEKLLEKKKKLKEKFDKEYDNKEGEESYFEDLKLEASKQAEMNKNQFEGLDDNIRVEIEGYRAGMYVRLEINEAPCELIDNFDSTYPLIIGGLQPGEQNIGYVKVRMKKHRWYKKILKTKDPLIISMGWRRFQTIAIYSKQEDNMRHRMLKYTPEHIACMGHFWGPMTPGGTGFLALLNAGSMESEPGFRIVATGAVVDTSQSTVITKKLKLIGTPMKIYKKTAFIKGMFNSALEVAKFEGSKIKTVSGIRGQIKKPLNKPEGVFRATFEDKILLSDIVFCRTWYKVDVPKLYIPITTLLLPPTERNRWEGMRTLGILKREKGIRNEAQPDSMYTKIQRPPKISRQLVIPRTLERELPYSYKPKDKNGNSIGPGSYMKQVRKIVVRDEHETKVADLLQKLRTSYTDKQIKLKKATKERIAELKKRKQDSELRKVRKHKEIKKSIYRTLSKLEARKEKNMK